jgi:hypothetical protein
MSQPVFKRVPSGQICSGYPGRSLKPGLRPEMPFDERMGDGPGWPSPPGRAQKGVMDLGGRQVTWWPR